jgi:glycosyltransferase involved in cell wall biosynthesis
MNDRPTKVIIAESVNNPAAPIISILIPAYNEERLIGRTLDSVHGSFEAISCKSYEVIVCDNNSTDRTGELAAAKGAKVVIEPHNQIARARNTAAKSAWGKWLIFLDGDTLLTPEVLEMTIRTLEEGKICAGGCQLRFDRQDIGLFPAFMTGLWNRVSGFVNLAAGSYLFCWREAWEELGGFDEEVYAGEEIFFSQSLKKWAKERGMKFRVLPGATVVTSARKMDWYGQRQLLWHVLMMLRPGAIKRKELCDIWYTRPE